MQSRNTGAPQHGASVKKNTARGLGELHQSLPGMRELEILRLGRNPIIDFSPLVNLDKLKVLEVDREKLTESSLVEIKASNPKINIQGVN